MTLNVLLIGKSHHSAGFVPLLRSFVLLFVINLALVEKSPLVRTWNSFNYQDTLVEGPKAVPRRPVRNNLLSGQLGKT